MINTLKMERNNCEIVNIESLSGGNFPQVKWLWITHMNTRMERNNHTSANIEGSGRGKFGLENRIETRLSSGEISPNEK